MNIWPQVALDATSLSGFIYVYTRAFAFAVFEAVLMQLGLLSHIKPHARPFKTHSFTNEIFIGKGTIF